VVWKEQEEDIAQWCLVRHTPSHVKSFKKTAGRNGCRATADRRTPDYEEGIWTVQARDAEMEESKNQGLLQKEAQRYRKRFIVPFTLMASSLHQHPRSVSRPHFPTVVSARPLSPCASCRTSSDSPSAARPSSPSARPL